MYTLLMRLRHVGDVIQLDKVLKLAKNLQKRFSLTFYFEGGGENAVLAKKRTFALLVVFPLLAVAAYAYVHRAPGYTPADNARVVADTLQVNLQHQISALNQSKQTQQRLAEAITTLNQQIGSMQVNYQKHLLSLAQQGLIQLNNGEGG